MDKIVKQLQKKSLTTEDRIVLLNAIMDKLHMPKLNETIKVDVDGVYLNGKPLTGEDKVNFVLSMDALKDNPARKLVNHHLEYLAVKMGVHESVSIETLMFAKAIIWILNEERKIIEQFSTGD